MGSAFTVFEAGFALKTHGSLVKGFTPLRAGVAGLFFNLRLITLPILNDPFFFNCWAANETIPSTAPFTSLGFKPTLSATALYTPATVKPPPDLAFAFAFIAAGAAFAAGAFMAAFIGNILTRCHFL